MNPLTQDEKYELVDALEEAKAHMEEAIEIVEQYVQMTDDENARAYLLSHMKIMACRDNGYLTHDMNLDDLIDRVWQRYPDDEEEEETDD